MKYLKKWKLFESHDDIHRICKEYGITNYTINPDGSIDVDRYVNFRDNNLTKLPLKFRNVSGYFDCHNNKLTSLEGAPLSVDGYFDCDYNQLTTLDNLPNLSGYIYMVGNPVYSIVQDWIQDPEERWEKWEYFQDLNIIQGDRVILPRLEEFHEVMEIEMPNLNEIKKYYKIIQ